jgi:hypothetical protein
MAEMARIVDAHVNGSNLHKASSKQLDLTLFRTSTMNIIENVKKNKVKFQNF